MGFLLTTINTKVNKGTPIVATKKVVRRHKEPPAPAPAPATKSFSTAALGIGMVILTNYQAEVKQILALLFKTTT